MNLKALSTILTLFLMLAIVVPIVSVTGQTVPNPNHVYTTSIGMPETIDPGWAYDTASGGLIHNILEPLCIFNVTDVSGFLPALADDWAGLGVGKNEMIPSAPDSGAPSGTVETW